MGKKREEELKKQDAIRIVASMLAMIGLVLYLMGDQSNLSKVISATSSTVSKRKCHNPIDWSVDRVEDLTLDQIIEYVEWTNSTSCRLTHDFGGHVHKEGVNGQKAVCLDPLVRPEKDSECLVYSFGINNDWTFDEAIEQMGCRVYAFDPSMNVENHDHKAKIHFYNLGLGDRDERWNKDSNMNWTMKSLDSIYHNLLQHDGRIIDYLKIDIQHSEWIVLPQILSSGMMDRVRQLALDVHLPERGGLDEFRRRVGILKSLEDYGLVRFDSKFNPWSLKWNVAIDWEGYNAYEIVWYNSRIHRDTSSATQPSVAIKTPPANKKKKIHNRANIKKSKYRNMAN